MLKCSPCKHEDRSLTTRTCIQKAGCGDTYFELMPGLGKWRQVDPQGFQLAFPTSPVRNFVLNNKVGAGKMAQLLAPKPDDLSSSWDPRLGREKVNPSSCFLSSTLSLWHLCVYMHL